MGNAQVRLRQTVFVCCVFAFLALAAFFFWPAKRINSIQGPVSSTIQNVGPDDLPAQIENQGDGKHIWALRAKVAPESLSPALAEAIRFIADSSAIIARKLTARGEQRPRHRILSPLLAQTGSPPLLADLSPEFGDVMDAQGRPVRWLIPENILASYSVPRPQLFQIPPERPANPQFAAALARLAPARNANDYRKLVDSFASRYGLNTDLVMAIIHSESNFSPNLVSPRSAMGLMQLLPSTASDEVHRFLYGRRGQISFEQLSVPEINIRYGTTYLHILNDRYFANVRDKQVREACVIASYNMGPNGFLRLYGSTPEQAVARINSMGADEFHADLQRRLPMRETRFYVEKVKRMKQHYASMR